MVPNAAASVGDSTSRDSVGPGDRVGSDGRYELLVRIGSGGMGAVYRARDHKLQCERAVKVLDGRFSTIPAFVERFRREAMAASRVAHPNIVSVLDVAAEGERPVFLVMELLEGKTISQLVRGSGRLPWAQVHRYIDQIAAGLGAAHAQGVVHRDVKPGNCLVLPDDQVKVLDFGIAKVTDMPAEVVALTAAGEIIGTCSYMAPEQIRGQVDTRSDIYALGVLTFRMLTGRVPFEHREQDKVLLAHLTEPPPTPSSLVQGLPPGVDDFVLRMLAKQPHKRFDGMEELRRVLAGIERGLPVALEDPTALPPSRGPSPTAMFEEAPTRAVVRGVPSTATDVEGEPVRRTINTAPAGSGALAQLEAERAAQPGAGRGGDPARTRPDGPAKVGPAGTVALDGVAELGAGPAGTVALEGVVGVGAGPVGTVVLDDPRAPMSGGTVVVHGQAAPVPVPAAIPPEPVGPVKTQQAPAPRRLANLPAASVASPRVTRLAGPSEPDRGGVMRGVVAAFGGIALAGAVVVGWVMWQRHEAASEVPAAAPAAAAARGEVDAVVAPEGADEAVEADDAGPTIDPPIERREPTETTEPVEPAKAEAKAEAASTPVPEATERSEPRDPPREATDEPTPKKRKTPKAKSSAKAPGGATATSEPKPKPEPPQPEPDEPQEGKRKGDLRDPF